jgi:hypothetical protein
MTLKNNSRLFIIIAILCTLCALYAISAVVEVDNFRFKHPSRAQPITGFVKLRSAAVLTNAYVDTNVVRMDHYKNIAVAFDITKASLTSMEYIVWWSKDGTFWYREVTESVAAGVITHVPCYYTIALTGDAEVFASFPFYGNYVKLQVKGTGTVTGSSCKVSLFGSY